MKPRTSMIQSGTPREEIEHPEEIDAVEDCSHYGVAHPSGYAQKSSKPFRRFNDDCVCFH